MGRCGLEGAHPRCRSEQKAGVGVQKSLQNGIISKADYLAPTWWVAFLQGEGWPNGRPALLSTVTGFENLVGKALSVQPT